MTAIESETYAGNTRPHVPYFACRPSAASSYAHELVAGDTDTVGLYLVSLDSGPLHVVVADHLHGRTYVLASYLGADKSAARALWIGGES
jgi:hypothetical protein